MAQPLVMDEFHLTLYAPRGLRDAEYEVIQRALNSARFQGRLLRAARAVVRQHRSLRKVRVALSR